MPDSSSEINCASASQWLKDNQIEAIFFDLDNTLIDRQAAFEKYSKIFCQQHSVDDADFVDEMVAADELGYRSREEWAEWLQKRIKKKVATSDAKSIEVSTILADFFKILPTQFEPDPTTDELVSLFGELVPIAIVSNGTGPTQRMKLKHSGLDQIVEHILISGEVNSWKPDLAIFKLASETVNTPLERIMMIGDDPDRDIGPASKLGMKSIWISLGRQWKNADCVPDFLIGSFSEIGRLFQVPQVP